MEQRINVITLGVADVPRATAFYEALGFSVVGRSPTDGGGRPFPILHMRRGAPGIAGVV
jgi:putative acetyltransferase